LSKALKCADCGGGNGPFATVMPEEINVCPDCATERLRPFLHKGYRVELTPPVVRNFVILNVKDPKSG